MSTPLIEFETFVMVARPKKLLDQMRDAIRLKHYSYRTEQSYVDWVYRFIVFHNKRHPKEMGPPEIEAFLTHLAVQRRMAASNQNQALSALVFLYHHVLHQDMGGQIDTVPAKQSRYLSTCWHRLTLARIIPIPQMPATDKACRIEALPVKEAITA
jgi:hypothetical protein